MLQVLSEVEETTRSEESSGDEFRPDRRREDGRTETLAEDSALRGS
jgi:hypothetical protein